VSRGVLVFWKDSFLLLPERPTSWGVGRSPKKERERGKEEKTGGRQPEKYDVSSCGEIRDGRGRKRGQGGALHFRRNKKTSRTKKLIFGKTGRTEVGYDSKSLEKGEREERVGRDCVREGKNR